MLSEDRTRSSGGGAVQRRTVVAFTRRTGVGEGAFRRRAGMIGISVHTEGQRREEMVGGGRTIRR